MSRGPGRLQRAVLAELEMAPERKLNRLELEERFVEGPYDASNLLRAIRGLASSGRVLFRDEPDKAQATLKLPPQRQAVPEDKVAALLREIDEREDRDGKRPRNHAEGDPQGPARRPRRPHELGSP